MNDRINKSCISVFTQSCMMYVVHLIVAEFVAMEGCFSAFCSYVHADANCWNGYKAKEQVNDVLSCVGYIVY